MEKNLYIDASHPDETRVVLKSSDHIEEYEYENNNTLNLKSNPNTKIAINNFKLFLKYTIICFKKWINSGFLKAFHELAIN